MNRIPFLRFAALTLLLVASGRQARADFMFHWTVAPNANGVFPSGSGSVALTLAQDGTGTSAGGTIPAAAIAVSSGAKPTSPDTYDVKYQLTLHLSDTNNGQPTQTGALTYNGEITGTASTAGATMTNTFSDPLTQKLVLGSHTYTVTIQPTTVTWAGLAPTSTPITAKISVDGQSVQPTPEPSALLLAGLAAPALGYFWRRRNAARMAAA
jgi:hypothetical protein